MCCFRFCAEWRNNQILDFRAASPLLLQEGSFGRGSLFFDGLPFVFEVLLVQRRFSPRRFAVLPSRSVRYSEESLSLYSTYPDTPSLPNQE